jgi:hypothetical protein
MALLKEPERSASLRDYCADIAAAGSTDSGPD